MTLLILPNTGGAVTSSYCPVVVVAGASRTQIDQSNINLFLAEYKATKKLGGSLTIFAVLTARTLYTYKYEVAINNDKLHHSASVFYPWNLHLGMSPSVGSAGHLSGLHLSGFPSGRPTCPAGRRTPCHRRVSLVLRGWRTPGRVGGVPAAGPAEHGGFLLPIQILVSHSLLRSF